MTALTPAIAGCKALVKLIAFKNLLTVLPGALPVGVAVSRRRAVRCMRVCWVVASQAARCADEIGDCAALMEVNFFNNKVRVRLDRPTAALLCFDGGPWWYAAAVVL